MISPLWQNLLKFIAWCYAGSRQHFFRARRRISTDLRADKHAAHLEDDFSVLLVPYVPNPEEVHAVTGRMKTRENELQDIDEEISDLEHRLHNLRNKKYNLQRTNAVGQALLVAEMIALESTEDDMEILSTGYIPSAQEASLMRLRLEARRQHMRCLKKASRIKGTTQEDRLQLITRRTLLKRSCVVGDALLAPIRKLPTELIGHIFALSIPALRLEPIIEDYRDNRYPVHNTEPHPHLARGRISQVCRRWNRILCDTPDVWTTLALDFPLSLDPSNIARCLRNSRACLLDIFVDTSEWFDFAHADHVPVVLRMLRDEFKRFRIFIIQRSIQEELLHLFPIGITTLASSLEICTIETDPPEDHDAIVLGHIDCPKLESLVVLGATCSINSFLDVTDLPMRRLIMGRYPSQTEAPWSVWRFDKLASCRHLEVLHLTFGAIEPALSSTAIRLSSLKELSLTSEDPVSFQQILEPLHVPALDTLELGAGRVDGFVPPVTEAFESFPEEIIASIRHLTLHLLSFTGDRVGPTLARLKNLQTLRIINSDLDEIFFTVLAPHGSMEGESDVWLCPNLSKLVLSGTAVHGEGLIRLVVLRTTVDTEERGKGHLTSVRVRSCRGLESHHIDELWRLKETRHYTLGF